MKTADRVVLNTIVLYAKIILNMLISLISVPLILRALGQSDYGLYNLIAGVVGMLSFLNASMSIATQRFLSVAIGENNHTKLNEIYNAGIFLHILIGVIVVIGFEIAALFLFNGFLNIPPERVHTAKQIYQFLVLSTFFTILSVPYGAVLNAKENMLVFSIISVSESALKLVLAIYLLNCPFDKLIVYGLGIAILSISVTFANRFYVKIRYREFVFNPKRFLRIETFKSMFGFAGWNTLGAMATIGRNQGNAIIINIFFGTLANAAYGVANQINGILSQFSVTIQRSLNPQLMQSEGTKNRDRLIRIALLSSKTSVLLFSLFAIPLALEMPFILTLWLNDVPDNAVALSQLILLLTLVSQYSSGLKSAIQAVGRIKGYFIIMSTLLLATLPITYLCFKGGCPIYYSLIVFVLMEIVSLATRIAMSEKIVGIQSAFFFRNVIVQTIVCIIGGALLPILCHFILNESVLRVIISFLLFWIVYLPLVWVLALEEIQKDSIRKFFKKLIRNHQ